jgi:hypothetical protein
VVEMHAFRPKVSQSAMPVDLPCVILKGD